MQVVLESNGRKRQVNTLIIGGGMAFTFAKTLRNVTVGLDRLCFSTLF